MKYQHIAVAVDFSDPSRHALREAGRLAKRSEGSLLVLHILEGHAAHLFEKELEEDPTRLREALGGQLEDWIRETVPEDVRTETRLLTGSPSRDLFPEVEAFQAELLIVGTRGKSHPHRRLGTIAGMLTRQARIPVLLANPDASPIQSLVVCIDYSPICEELMEHALSIAEAEGLEIHAIHNAPSAQDSYANLALTSGLESYGSGRVDPETMREIDREQERRLKEFVEAYQEKARPRRIRHFLTQNLNDARGILMYLERVPNPLAILGAHGKSGIRDAIMGTTTERVLHGSPGNALVIRQREPSAS